MRKKKKEHKEVILYRHPVQCDEGISDLVWLLNCCPHTHTLYSCQGSHYKNDGGYVLFLSSSTTVMGVIQALAAELGVKFVSNVYRGICIRHAMYFSSTQQRKDFERKLRVRMNETSWYANIESIQFTLNKET